MTWLRRFDVSDWLFMAGVAAIVYGVALIYRPAALIIGGAILIGFSMIVFSLKKKGDRDGRAR